MGDASMSVEQGIVVEQQPVTENIFDTEIKRLFSENVEGNMRNSRQPATPSELEDLKKFLSAQGRFTDNWWKGLYKWLDERNFHSEKYSIAQITFESLDTLPPDAKLPHEFSYWASGALKDPQQKERIVNTLENPEIPATLRSQIPAQLARQPDVWSLDLILKGYKLFGEPVGQEIRKNIVPLFMSGLAVEEVFSSNRDALVQLYTDTASDTQNKKSSILSRVSQQFSKFRVGHHLPSSTPATSEKKIEESGRRVETIRDLVRELFPTYEEYHNKWEELNIRSRERLNHKLSEIVPLTKDEHDISERLSRHESEISNQYCNAWGVGRDISMLPLDVLERYLTNVRQLKTVPDFNKLGRIVFGDGTERGLLTPYTALVRTWIPQGQLLSHLKEQENSGKLYDQIVDDVLIGIDKDIFSNDQMKAVARRNLRILIKHQLPQEIHIFNLPTLLTTSQEDVLGDELETVASLQKRDSQTAALLLSSLSNFNVFGDKYKIALNYISRKREREDIRRIGALKHQDKVSKDLEKIQLTDYSGTRQGEKLVKLAVTLDAISELNDPLQLGISDVVIVPDLRTSYDNARNTLKEIFQKIGIADIEEGYKFLPWLKTKDETALKILREEEVEKIGEARSYNLQASAKFDLEGMKKEIEGYAQAIGVELPEVSLEDLNLESLKQVARYVVAELSKKRDLSEEVLGEVKPNLNRIITSINKGGSYTFSINPQDMKSQLEALQNVSSCLSPGGTMFRYTKEYLKNPNTFWAIIKRQQGVVGRVTMFQGTNESGNPAIARVSKVYAQVPIDESEVDKALRSYADETNTSFVESGKLTAPGLKDFYDDFIGTGRGHTVEVKR